jgi:uncharacterized Rmd1/YagE family protein
MASVSVNAYGFEDTFRLRELEPIFAELGPARIAKDELWATPGDGAFAIAYDFGAAVFVGVDPDAQKRTVAAITERMATPRTPITEDFAIETGGAAEVYEVRFDRVVVPSLSREVVDIVGLVLAQSVAMDFYAEDVATIEASTDRITAELRVRGRLRGRLRELSKFIGLCIATRNEVISTLALFDKPDVTWENEQLDRLWNGLYRMLELDDRYRHLEAKLRMIQDNLVVLVDLARQRHTFFLEATIVALIVFEIVITLWQIAGGAGH